MGFVDNSNNSLINEEQKIRIYLSERAKSVIAEDMDTFCVSKPATFINTVFFNYKDQAESSISLYLQQKRIDFERIFSDSGLNDTQRDYIVNRLLEEEKITLKQKLKALTLSNGSSKLYHINDRNVDYLTNITEEDQYYSRPGLYVRSVLEEYCSLPFIKRERIYRKEIYDKIENACRQKRVLKVTVPNHKTNTVQTYWVYPYKIVPTSFHTQDYLVCYSRRQEDPDNTKKMASFSMARISDPTCLTKSFHLNQKEIAKLEESLTQRSPAYLIEETEQIKVRLTPKGKRIFKTKLYSRPEKIEGLSHDDIYVFNCTRSQIYNYFFSLAAEVEIMEPLDLRKRFIDAHNAALNNYPEAEKK